MGDEDRGWRTGDRDGIGGWGQRWRTGERGQGDRGWWFGAGGQRTGLGDVGHGPRHHSRDGDRGGG